jgi:hypothetical protein
MTAYEAWKNIYDYFIIDKLTLNLKIMCKQTEFTSMPKTGIDMIIQERNDQLTIHNFTVENDVKTHPNGELLRFAHYLISADNAYFPNGFSKDYVHQFFMQPRLKQLAIAAACIAAEIDRLIAVELASKTDTEY